MARHLLDPLAHFLFERGSRGDVVRLHFRLRRFDARRCRRFSGRRFLLRSLEVFDVPQAHERVDDGGGEVLPPDDGACVGGPLRAGNGDERVVVEALRGNEERSRKRNRLAGNEEGNRGRHVRVLRKGGNCLPLGFIGGGIKKRHEKFGELPEIRF